MRFELTAPRRQLGQSQWPHLWGYCALSILLFLFKNGVKERNPSPEVEGLTPSEQPTGRRLFEAQGGVSPAAAGDLRLCLKKPQTFEKV